MIQKYIRTLQHNLFRNKKMGFFTSPIYISLYSLAEKCFKFIIFQRRDDEPMASITDRFSFAFSGEDDNFLERRRGIYDGAFYLWKFIRSERHGIKLINNSVRVVRVFNENKTTSKYTEYGITIYAKSHCARTKRTIFLREFPEDARGVQNLRVSVYTELGWIYLGLPDFQETMKTCSLRGPGISGTNSRTNRSKLP